MKKLEDDVAKISQSVNRASPAMEASEYLSKLAKLDFTKPTEAEDFVASTQGQKSENGPKPVPLGAHDGVEYFLISDYDSLPKDARYVLNWSVKTSSKRGGPFSASFTDLMEVWSNICTPANSE